MNESLSLRERLRNTDANDLEHGATTTEALAADLDEILSDAPLPQPQEPVRQAVAVSEADQARSDIKRRIKQAYAAATHDLDYCNSAIAEIDKAVAAHEVNRQGLVQMRDEAKERIVKAKFALSRFV